MRSNLYFSRPKLRLPLTGIVIFAVIVYVATRSWLASTNELVIVKVNFFSGVMPRVVVPDSVSISDLRAATLVVLDRVSPGHGYEDNDLWMQEIRMLNKPPPTPKAHLVKYWYSHLARRRFDLRLSRYVMDSSDPIAHSRNLALEKAIREAAATFVKSANLKE